MGGGGGDERQCFKGASPNYFGKDNVILTLGGGGGGGGGGGTGTRRFQIVLNLKNGLWIPTILDINDVKKGYMTFYLPK